MIFYLDPPGNNHFTTYNHVIACAIENNVTVLNLGLKDYAPYLAGTSADVFSRFPSHKSFIPPTPQRRATAARWAQKLQRSVEKGKLKSLKGGTVGILRSSTETTLGKTEAEKQKMIVNLDGPEFRAQLRSMQAIFLSGPLLRAQESVRKHYPKVRDFFRLADKYQAEMEAPVRALRREAELVIGVHIRRTDFAKFMGGRFVYSVEQYRTCMARTKELFPDKTVKFLIQSDEQFHTDAFEGFAPEFAKGLEWMQIYTLAQCDYLIGPPSTSLSWASFYNQVPHYKIMDPDKIPSRTDFVINRG